jgi:hypothetical protein
VLESTGPGQGSFVLFFSSGQLDPSAGHAFDAHRLKRRVLAPSGEYLYKLGTPSVDGFYITTLLRKLILKQWPEDERTCSSDISNMTFKACVLAFASWPSWLDSPEDHSPTGKGF